jgi:hypothetical protein
MRSYKNIYLKNRWLKPERLAKILKLEKLAKTLKLEELTKTHGF